MRAANGASTAARSSASQSPAMNASPKPMRPSRARAGGRTRRGRMQRMTGASADRRRRSSPSGSSHPHRQARHDPEEERAGDRGVDRPSGGAATRATVRRGTSGAASRTDRRRAVIVRRSARMGLQTVASCAERTGRGTTGTRRSQRRIPWQADPRDHPQAGERVPQRGADERPDRARLPGDRQRRAEHRVLAMHAAQRDREVELVARVGEAASRSGRRRRRTARRRAPCRRSASPRRRGGAGSSAARRRCCAPRRRRTPELAVGVVAPEHVSGLNVYPNERGLASISTRPRGAVDPLRRRGTRRRWRGCSRRVAEVVAGVEARRARAGPAGAPARRRGRPTTSGAGTRTRGGRVSARP